MPSYKLTYFDNQARGEAIRWLFAVAKQPFEDNRIQMKDWPGQKSNFFFGVIPALEVDGQQLSQSNAILDYLGREFGLTGKTPLEQARVNMIALTINDALYKHTAAILRGPSAESRSEHFKKFESEEIPFYLERFEKLLKENNDGNGYFVGDSLTYADTCVVCYIDELDNIFRIKVVFDKYPKLAALKDRVESNEGLADWLAKRPRYEKSLMEIFAAAMASKPTS